MSENKYPVAIHDYRDFDSYGFSSDENGRVVGHGKNYQAWAWEFLRRNADYQRDFDAYALSNHDEGELSDGADLFDSNLLDVENQLHFKYGVHHFVDYSIEWDGVPNDIFVAQGELPNDKHGPWLVPYAERLPVETRDHPEALHQSGRLIVFGFDLHSPIDRQIESLRRDLISQKKAGKYITDKLPNNPGKTGVTQLRILDGEAVSATPADFFKAFDWDPSSSGSMLRRQTKRAIAYRDIHYRTLHLRPVKDDESESKPSARGLNKLDALRERAKISKKDKTAPSRFDTG